MAEKSVQKYGHADPQVIPATAVGSGGTYKAGDLVKWNGSGLLVVGTALKISGIAKSDWVASAKQEIELLDPNAIYVIRAKSDETTLQNMVGESWGLNYTAGAHYVTRTTDANNVVYIVGIHPADGAGATGGRYLVRFMHTLFTESGA